LHYDKDGADYSDVNGKSEVQDEQKHDGIEQTIVVDACFVVSTFIEYRNVDVALETKYDFNIKKWLSNVRIGDKISTDILHKQPIYTPETTRDQQFIERIESTLEIKQKNARTILNNLIDKASEKKSDIDRFKEKKEVGDVETIVFSTDDPKFRYKTIKNCLHILENIGGKYTVEEIKAAQVILKYNSMHLFWHEKENKEGEATVVLNKINIADHVRVVHNIVNTGVYKWRYDWDNAFYRFDTNNLVIRDCIHDIMKEVGQPNLQYNGNITKDINDILTSASLGPSVYINSPFNQYKGHINTKNGVIKLDFENRKAILIGKQPKFMFNYCLDTYYDPNADPTQIDRFLEEVVEQDQKEIIYQIAALAIRDADVNLAPSKVCYYFQGPPHSGKNAVLNLLRKCIGDANTSSIPLHDLAANQFAKALLEGKLLNVNDEVNISSAINESREIKTLTGGKRHTINRKNIQQYDSYITALLVFAGNHFPKYEVPRDDEAFWGRWDIVRFRNQFTVNESFESKLFTPENMSGFLNKVIEALFNLYENGVKRLAKSPLETYNEWKLGSSSVFRFVHEAMVPTKTQMNHIKSDLHKTYREWCENPANNVSRESIRYQADTFGKDLVMECGAIQGHIDKLNVYRMFWKLKPFDNQAIQDHVGSETSQHQDSITKQISEEDPNW
jgi:P4 family phage/plasmid primase-like protien